MGIDNIMDRRTNKYCVDVKAIFEASWQHNTCKGATQFEEVDDFYHEIPKTTISKAIKFAKGYTFPITLFLYDPDLDLSSILEDKIPIADEYVLDEYVLDE